MSVSPRQAGRRGSAFGQGRHWGPALGGVSAHRERSGSQTPAIGPRRPANSPGPDPPGRILWLARADPLPVDRGREPNNAKRPPALHRPLAAQYGRPWSKTPRPRHHAGALEEPRSGGRALPGVQPGGAKRSPAEPQERRNTPRAPSGATQALVRGRCPQRLRCPYGARKLLITRPLGLAPQAKFCRRYAAHPPGELLRLRYLSLATTATLPRVIRFRPFV